jgi:hypothetical protein
MKTKSLLKLFAGIISVAAFAGCKANLPYVVWTEGETDPATRRACHVITVVNAPEGTDWNLWLT